MYPSQTWEMLIVLLAIGVFKSRWTDFIYRFNAYECHQKVIIMSGNLLTFFKVTVHLKMKI